jgi:hypothetical protein
MYIRVPNQLKDVLGMNIDASLWSAANGSMVAQEILDWLLPAVPLLQVGWTHDGRNTTSKHDDYDIASGQVSWPKPNTTAFRDKEPARSGGS